MNAFIAILQGYRCLANEIRKFYFGDKVLNESLEYQYFKFTSDINWVYVVDESVRNVSKISKGKTYYAWYDREMNKSLLVFKPNIQTISVGSENRINIVFSFG